MPAPRSVAVGARYKKRESIMVLFILLEYYLEYYVLVAAACIAHCQPFFFSKFVVLLDVSSINVHGSIFVQTGCAKRGIYLPCNVPPSSLSTKSGTTTNSMQQGQGQMRRRTTD